MKPIYFFLGLLITISIIYLVCQEKKENFENFPDQSNLPTKDFLIQQDLAQQFGLDVGRIRNFQEIGHPGETSQYQIKFNIYPRNVADQADPLISNLVSNLKKRVEEKKFPKITTPEGQDIFLSEIQFKLKDIIDPVKEVEKEVQFINPSLNGQIKYLEDQQRGIKRDPVLDRSHRFSGGQIVLDPEPTQVIPTPTPDIPMVEHPLTDQATTPTISMIE